MTALLILGLLLLAGGCYIAGRLHPRPISINGEFVILGAGRVRIREISYHLDRSVTGTFSNEDRSRLLSDA